MKRNLLSLSLCLLFTVSAFAQGERESVGDTVDQVLPAMEGEMQAPAMDKKMQTPAATVDHRLEQIRNSDFEPFQFQVAEEQLSMSCGVDEGLVMFIPDGSRKDVEKEWKKFLKPYGGKVTNSRNEIVSLGTEMSNLSNKSVDIFATVDKDERGSVISMLLYLNNEFVTHDSYPKEYESGKRLLKEFGHHFHQLKVQDELDETEKDFKKLQSESEKLVKDNLDLHEDIEKYKRLIQEAEQDIIDNDAAQVTNEKDSHNKSIDLDVVRWKLKAY